MLETRSVVGPNPAESPAETAGSAESVAGDAGGAPDGCAVMCQS